MPRTDRPRARRTASLALVAGLVVVSAPGALRHTWHRLAEVWTLRGENVADARRRAYGEAYWNRIEALRAEIPKDGDYVLSRDAVTEGSGYWIRFDLAPRKPILVAPKTSRELPVRPENAPPFVVSVRGPQRLPVLLDADTFWEGAPVLRPGLEDDRIPANIDEPAEGSHVRGPFVVQGWCQELGARPCAEVRILLDAEFRSVSVERFPRPDVEAVVPGIGNCGTAGYRAALQDVEAGNHVLWVLFRTGDGRYRRLGPRTFTVGR